MNKKANTLLFILGGTIFNIIVTVACFLVILALYSKLLYPILPNSFVPWILPISFVISIAVSFLVYRAAIKLFMKKVDMQKYFEPIFKKPR